MNIFDKVLIASRRSRELARGDAALVTSDHGPLMTALQELEQGKIGQEYLRRDPAFTVKKRHTWNKD